MDVERGGWGRERWMEREGGVCVCVCVSEREIMRVERGVCVCLGERDGCREGRVREREMDGEREVCVCVCVCVCGGNVSQLHHILLPPRSSAAVFRELPQLCR